MIEDFDDIEFYDNIQGPMLLRKWNGDPWLFYKGGLCTKNDV